MSSWTEGVPTDGTVELPPDPRALDAIGRNHRLETALADLVDNSIDAGASHVLIRIVRAGGKLRSLYVVDNGRGIVPDAINAAMTVGGRRSYGTDDLGHFGLGLKAASFSQARAFSIMSRAVGHPAVGRRWRLDGAVTGFYCDIVAERFAAEEVDGDWGIPASGSGTVIRWDEVSAFPVSDEPARVERFIEHTITAVGEHLGLVFHRFLEQERVTIEFEVRDAELGYGGVRVPVAPLNPFGYTRPGRVDFPKVVKATNDGVEVSFRCHIWPGRSTSPAFKLPGGHVERQGLYFYRHDRLLHAGGWDSVHAPHPRLQLARVEVDIDDDMVGLFRMNPEKSRVQVGPEFASICEAARSDDGMSFTGYLDIAEQVYRKSRERDKNRKAMIMPGAGLPPRVRATIEHEIPALAGGEAIDIRWRQFTDESFFEVDRVANTLWLNKRYRKVLLGGKHGGLNDLPLIKTLLYLVVENVFQGDRLGARDKDNIDLWQELLTTAVKAERQ
ncbi:histidine kinase [Saccharothrix sp. NRRL B-16348]|uniref:ATP-binding protein n=1 Tax=Saccharothrix sp. NRRL B-16348 TaxID=1415542 RepID=UPI0006AECA06|nr:ATP-binding protein [Saccharothrix sp. NRRL B-16348]KOX16822.1 histidine kinase [Saccharothrix sp. NRRL B-16348]